MDRCSYLDKLTFLSLWVGLDFQHHSGDSISIHVIQRVSYPLREEKRVVELTQTFSPLGFIV